MGEPDWNEAIAKLRMFMHDRTFLFSTRRAAWNKLQRLAGENAGVPEFLLAWPDALIFLKAEDVVRVVDQAYAQQRDRDA